MPDVLLVMVHVWEDMPELENIRWPEFAKKVVDSVNEVSWQKVWQFDSIDKKIYERMPYNKIYRNSKTEDPGRIPHPDIIYGDADWITTSDEQTAKVIARINPKIVMFGGLHKDLCVTGVKLAVATPDREYFVSDRLSYTIKETAKALYKDWG